MSNRVYCFEIWSKIELLLWIRTPRRRPVVFYSGPGSKNDCYCFALKMVGLKSEARKSTVSRLTIGWLIETLSRVLMRHGTAFLGLWNLGAFQFHLEVKIHRFCGRARCWELKKHLRPSWIGGARVLDGLVLVFRYLDGRSCWCLLSQKWLLILSKYVHARNSCRWEAKTLFMDVRTRKKHNARSKRKLAVR